MIYRVLNVVNVVPTLLGDGKVLPQHQLARHATTVRTRHNLHDLGRIVSSHARSCVEDMTTRWLGLHQRPTAVRVHNVQSK